VKNFEQKSLMPHSDRFPYLSRDWEMIDCANENCKWNRGKACSVPSLAKIGADGKCCGYESIDRNTKKETKNPITSLDIE